MEKKKYSKPVVVAERFEPQEYCATCWWIDPSDMYPVLYEDGSGLWNPRDGYYQEGEEVNLPTPIRIPQEGYYKEPNKPQPSSNSNYYTQYNVVEDWFFTRTPYSPMTTPVYTYRYRTGWRYRTYYFKQIRENGVS